LALGALARSKTRAAASVSRDSLRHRGAEEANLVLQKLSEKLFTADLHLHLYAAFCDCGEDRIGVSPFAGLTRRVVRQIIVETYGDGQADVLAPRLRDDGHPKQIGANQDLGAGGCSIDLGVYRDARASGTSCPSSGRRPHSDRGEVGSTGSPVPRAHRRTARRCRNAFR
jgi:hypothetical protein